MYRIGSIFYDTTTTTQRNHNLYLTTQRLFDLYLLAILQDQIGSKQICDEHARWSKRNIDIMLSLIPDAAIYTICTSLVHLYALFSIHLHPPAFNISCIFGTSIFCKV